MSILTKQADLVERFGTLPDWEERYKRIIQFGRELPPFPEAHRCEANLVRGCSSQVWLHAEFRDGRMYYLADSDALIVRGLVHMLVQVYSGEKPDAVLATPPEFIQELDLEVHLSPNRANGLHAMVKQIKAYAVAFKVKTG